MEIVRWLCVVIAVWVLISYFFTFNKLDKLESKIDKLLQSISKQDEEDETTD